MSNYRMMRIGLLLVVVIGGVIFHHQGRAYDAIRIVYLVVVLGFLAWRILLRTGGRTPRRSAQRSNLPPPGSVSGGPTGQ